MKIDNQKLNELVYNWPTKYDAGFIQEEYLKLASQFKNINMKKFNEALTGITCQMSNDNEFIIYHCDILTALKCGIENRNMTFIEFD